MTGTNDKVRSLFLSALMVVSVVAMTTAFSAGAVADRSGNDTIVITNTDNTELDYDDGTVSETQTIEFDAYLAAGDTETVTIDTSDAEEAGLTLDSVSISGDGGAASVTSEGDDEIVIELSNSDDENSVAVSGIDVDVTWNDDDAENTARATHEIFATGDDDDGAVEADFDYRVLADSSSQLGVDSSGTTTSAIDGDSIFRAEQVRFDVGTNTRVQVYENDDGDRGTRVLNANTGGLSSSIILDTSNLDAGDHFVVVGGTEVYGPSSSSNEGTFLRVEDLGLSAEAESSSITSEDEIQANVESAGAGDDITYRLLNSDGDVVEDDDDNDIEDTTTLDGLGEADISFPAADDSDYGTDNYSIEVEHGPTGITDTTGEINVSDAADADVSFAGNKVFEDERGDIAEVTVELTNTETATVVIGSEDQNYYYIAEVEDGSGDGEVTLQLNTYTAGAGSIAADSEQKATVADDDDEILNAHEGGDFFVPNGDSNDAPEDKLLGDVDYNLNATVGEELDSGELQTTDADDRGTLALRPRSTENQQIWTAPESTDAGDLEVSDVYASLGSSITQTDEVTAGDYAVHQIEASGIEGYIDNENDFFDAIASDTDQQLALTVEETEDSVGPNADPESLTLDSDNTDVILDPDNNTYFLVVDTDGLDDVETDNSYNATFTVAGEDSDVADNGILADDDENVSAEFTVVEEEASLDTDANDEVVVQSATEQTITGETNLAPGTDATVQVSSEGTASPFLASPEGTVQPDGTFSVSEDFSSVSPGTNLTLEVRVDGSEVGGDDEATFDGRVGEAATAEISASDQTTDGSSLTIDSVTLSEGGFVALHLNNASGAVVGNSSYLESGTTEDLEIDHQQLDANATVVPMAHVDSNDNEEYEFGEVEGADGPYTADGSPVVATVNVTVDAGDDSTPTPEPETDTPTPEPDTDTPEPDTDTPSMDTDTATEEPDDEDTTTGSGPGFGAVAALIGLLAAALLARRNN